MNITPGNIQTIEIPRWLLTTLNALYETECKLKVHGDQGNAMRNLARAKDSIEEAMHLFAEDPMNQRYNETRTDLEATISGSSTENLKVVEVIKPIIRIGERSFSRVIQKGIVIVQSDDSPNSNEGTP